MPQRRDDLLERRSPNHDMVARADTAEDDDERRLPREVKSEARNEGAYGDGDGGRVRGHESGLRART